MTQPKITQDQIDDLTIALGDLDDVGGVGSPSDGDTLTWDNSQGRWEAQAAASGGSTTANDVGTYALAKTRSIGGASDFGDTRAGSLLEPAHCGGSAQNGTLLAGTWRCMGYSLAGSSSSEGATTLWVRIA